MMLSNEAAWAANPISRHSPLCSLPCWRSRPMTRPITNAADRNAMITPMLNEHIGENDSGTALDGHDDG